MLLSIDMIDYCKGMSPRLVAVYRYPADARLADRRAREIAVEQSVEMPVAAIGDRFVLDEILGGVESVRDLGSGWFEARVALSVASVGSDAGQLLNVLFGNTSLHDDVVLHDVEVPPGLAKTLGGPAVGIDGLRARLRAYGRPVTLTNLKPQGLSPSALAELAASLAAGGVDLIKDDHALADQPFCPFSERAPRVADAVRAASRRTGVPTRYCPNLTGDLDCCAPRWRPPGDGLDCALALPMLIGFSAFQALRRENPDIAILAHPALAGATKIAPALAMGKLFRLIGADATVFPNDGGRFAASRPECLRLADFARAPWLGLRSTLPLPSGGMTIGRVPELASVYGEDVGVFLGGSLLASGEDLTRVRPDTSRRRSRLRERRGPSGASMSLPHRRREPRAPRSGNSSADRVLTSSRTRAGTARSGWGVGSK